MADKLNEDHSSGSTQPIDTVAPKFPAIHSQISKGKIPKYKPGDIESDSALLKISKSGRFNTKSIVQNDVDGVKTRSLDINPCSFKRNKTTETGTENNLLPVELMEKIICYVDGKTLLLFSLLSQECGAIVDRAVRYKKLWKKICQVEIPRRHFIDLSNKHLRMCVPLDSISEVQHETLYRHWLRWQSSVMRFSSTRLTEPLWPVFDVINSAVMRHKINFLQVFVDENCVYLHSFVQNDRKYAMHSSGSRDELRRLKTHNGHGIALDDVRQPYYSTVDQYQDDGSGSGNPKKLYTILELAEMASNSIYSTKFRYDRHPSVDPNVLLGGYHCRVIYIGVKFSSRNAIGQP